MTTPRSLDLKESSTSLEIKWNHGSRYKTISRQDAKSNTAYWNLVENMFREQAARLLQRRFRHRKKTYFKGKYEETLKGKVSLRFLKEPWGLKAKEHADKVLAGKWLELEFNEPEFVRNIYKALHQNKINSNQMVTALLLYEASNLFKESESETKEEKPNIMHQFKFGEGPYDTKSIFYATQKELSNFTEELKKVSPSEQCYFTINFSKKMTIAFLYDALNKNKFYENEDNRKILCNILKIYIQHANIDDDEKTKQLSEVEGLALNSVNSAKKLIDFLLINSREYSIWLRWGYDTLRDSSQFLINLLTVDEKIPSIIISPDADKQNPNTPLLAMVLPSISSLNALQFAIHGKDTTYPYFTAGQVSTRLIRFLDEEFEKFGLPAQSRPVELTHPDLAPNPSPHGASAHNFLLSWHDLFHCWRNGHNMYKPVFRYLRKLLTQEKGFDMSKAIWNLSDMDYGAGAIIRSTTDSYSLNMLTHKVISLILKDANCDPTTTVINDEKLLIMIDMIINHQHWQNFLGATPEQFFQSNGHMKTLMNFDFFQEQLKKLQHIVTEYPNQSYLFYIFAFKLKNHHENETLFNLLKQLDLKKMFLWNRNGGLYFKHSNISVESLNGNQLASAIMSIEKEVSVIKNQQMKTQAAEKISAVLLKTQNRMEKYEKERFFRKWNKETKSEKSLEQSLKDKTQQNNSCCVIL